MGIVMRTLAVKVSAAIWLLAFMPAATQAAWEILLPTDYRASLASKRALPPAKTTERHTEAVLEITCAPKGKQLSVSTLLICATPSTFAIELTVYLRSKAPLVSLARTPFQSTACRRLRLVLRKG